MYAKHLAKQQCLIVALYQYVNFKKKNSKDATAQNGSLAGLRTAETVAGNGDEVPSCWHFPQVFGVFSGSQGN